MHGRPFMVFEPLKEEKIPSKALSHCCLLIDSLLLFLGFELITSSRIASMGLPLDHAQPAELIPTPTLHSVAALVLFYWFRTTRTLLCVCKHPGCIFLLRLVFQLPSSSELARGGKVALPSTSQAHLGPTFTSRSS